MLLAAAVWGTLFTAACCWRFWAGLHHSRVNVSVAAIDGSDYSSVVVFARLASGTLWELRQDGPNTSIWTTRGRPPAVRTIVVAWYELPGPSGKDSLPEVRVGVNWQASRRVMVRQVPLVLGPPDPLLRGFAVVKEYGAVVKGSSLLSRDHDVLNWQDDWLFPTLCAVQALVGTLMCWITCLAVRTCSSANVVASSGGLRRFALVELPFDVLWLISIFLLGHQFLVYAQRLLGLSAAFQSLLGLLAALLLGLLILLWVRSVCSFSEPKRVIRRILLLTAAVSLIKIVWLSGIEFVPLGDYEFYLTEGTLAAEGRWRELTGSHYIFLRRAITFVYPIVCLFGSGLWKIEIANVIAQAVASLLITELARRLFGIRAAACSLPFLLLYPDFFYSAGLVTHNVWGYLWIAAAWLTYDQFIQSAKVIPGKTTLFRRIACAAGFGLAFGFLVVLIELSKSYGVFVLAATLLHLTAGRAIFACATGLASHERCSRVMRLIFAVCMLSCYRTAVQQTDGWLSEMSRSQLSSYGYTDRGIFGTFTSESFVEGADPYVWMNDFWRRLPEQNRHGVILRQLLYEKLANFGGWMLSITDKNRRLAYASDAMVLLQDSRSLQMGVRSASNFLLGISQLAACELFGCSIALLTLLRFLTLGRESLSEREIHSLLCTAAVLACIYLLIEAHPYYAQNLAYPFCLSAGVLTSTLAIRSGESAERFSSQRPESLGRYIRAAIAFCAVAGGLWIAGELLDRSELLFLHAKSAGEKETAKDPNGISAKSQVSRLHVSLTLATENAIVASGEEFSADFEVRRNSGPLRGLRFFISGNQMAVGQSIHGVWDGLPVEFVVKVNGREVQRGGIGSLRQARFIEIPFSFWSLPQDPNDEPAAVRLTLALRTTATFRRPRIGPMPAVAVSYMN